MKKYFIFLVCTVYVFISACKKNAGPAAPSGPTAHTAQFQYKAFPDASYSGVSDTTLDRQSDTMDSGSCLTMTVGVNGSDVDRAIIKFDVSSLPSNASVTGVTLTVGVASFVNTTTINTYVITTAWDEGPGCGGTAAGSQAAWNSPWINPGGDLGNTATVSSVSVDYNTAIFVDFNINTAAVRQWIVDPASNNGIELIAGDEVAGGYAVFNAKEAPNPNDRPMLTVHYTQP